MCPGLSSARSQKMLVHSLMGFSGVPNAFFFLSCSAFPLIPPASPGHGERPPFS